jgi:hypothetical protein
MVIEQFNDGLSYLSHLTYLGYSDVLLEESLNTDIVLAGAVPGSSYLWVGGMHCLSREEVRELVGHLNRWLETKTLKPKESKS